MTRRLAAIGRRTAYVFATILLWGAVTTAQAAGSDDGLRRVVTLNGIWQIAEGSMDKPPDGYTHEVPVPGLADMARPPFEAVGVKDKDPHRQAFWYRRTFTLNGPVPAVALLKIHKACYGTKVILNGASMGEHLPCFTPALLNVRNTLKGQGQINELIVRVGADRTVLPKDMPDGWDFEKVRYIPGIYDNVELILSGTPHIVRVQVVPDVPSKTARVVALIRNDGPASEVQVAAETREASTKRRVGQARSETLAMTPEQERTVTLTLPITDCRLWSPEDPFLYELDVTTANDALTTRFGMRSFRFDPATKLPLLNEKPYLLRGTNICIYRFFEDPQRGDKPWNEAWARRVIRLFRDMHWNSARYCIGFPPEIWYRIADEEGLLVQDEFPIWYGTRWPSDLKSDRIIPEYTEWMQERWNHPCVIIWDAQNESVCPETGKALQAVRSLDLSNRPWDNGWSEPQSPTDIQESHPYLFISPAFQMKNLAKSKPAIHQGIYGGAAKHKGNPVVINEYGWLWLNRDGTPTTLSKTNYERLLGPNATPTRRRETYARLLAAKTEMFRCQRQMAGVLHFCGLGYARPDGQTSDNFQEDLRTPTFDPSFYRYVRDAFAPVGLMVDEWEDDLPPGKPRVVSVVVINDLQTDWQGVLQFRCERGKQTVIEKQTACRIAPIGKEVFRFEVQVPSKPGRYQWVAEIPGIDGRPVQSLRDFEVLSDSERRSRAERRATHDGIAAGKAVTTSSSVSDARGHFPPQHAVDGDASTRWSSEFSDPQWIAVDLGSVTRIRRLVILWEAAYGKAYSIQVSSDSKTWKDVFHTESADGGTDEIDFSPVDARWVRMNGTRRGSEWGYSIWEFKVFK